MSPIGMVLQRPRPPHGSERAGDPRAMLPVAAAGARGLDGSTVMTGPACRVSPTSSAAATSRPPGGPRVAAFMVSTLADPAGSPRRAPPASACEVRQNPTGTAAPRQRCQPVSGRCTRPELLGRHRHREEEPRACELVAESARMRSACCAEDTLGHRRDAGLRPRRHQGRQQQERPATVARVDDRCIKIFKVLIGKRSLVVQEVSAAEDRSKPQSTPAPGQVFKRLLDDQLVGHRLVLGDSAGGLPGRRPGLRSQAVQHAAAARSSAPGHVRGAEIRRPPATRASMPPAGASRGSGQGGAHTGCPPRAPGASKSMRYRNADHSAGLDIGHTTAASASTACTEPVPSARIGW